MSPISALLTIMRQSPAAHCTSSETVWDHPARLPSTIIIRISASRARSSALRIPSPSISSRVSRTPAVSSKVSGIPLISIFVSRTSRVVPAWWDTIATDRPVSRLRAVDFPAFTGPTSAAVKPFRIISPRRPWSKTSRRLSSNNCRLDVICATVSGGNSSSAKSINASSNADNSIISCRHAKTGFESVPCI